MNQLRTSATKIRQNLSPTNNQFLRLQDTVDVLEKEGIELDGTHTLQSTSKKSPDEKEKEGKDEKETKEADETQDGQQKESAEAEENKEEKETEGEKDKEGDTEEKPEKEEETKEPDFIGKVTEKISAFDLTEEEQEQFLSDLGNWGKYTKSNTERAMKLSEREKSVGDLELANNFAQFLGTEKVKKILDLLEKMTPEDRDDLRSATNDWFKEPGENPVGMLFDLMLQAAPEATKLTKAQMEQAERDAELKFRKEVLDIQEIDPAYKDENTLGELADIADENKVNLAVAHKIRIADNLQSSLNESNKKIKALEKEVLDLKKQNEEMKKNLPSHRVPKKEEKKEEETKEFEPESIRSKMEYTETMDDVEINLRKKFNV